MSPASALLSWRQPAKDANRLRVGGVLLRSPGAPSDSGMQRVPFCLKEPKCNLLAPVGNSENWANMLSWHSARNKNIQRRDFMLLEPRNSSSKVLGGGDKGLLKPEDLRKKCVPRPRPCSAARAAPMQSREGRGTYLAAAYCGHGSVTSLPASAFGPGPHHRHGYSKSA